MHPAHSESRRKAPRSARGAGRALVLAGVLSGCPAPPPGPVGPPYDDGPLERDPACTLTGALQVTLGEGDGDDFTPLAEGQLPVVHYGPQGGTHLSLGVRVDNPATAFPGLKLDFADETQYCDALECHTYTARYSTVVRSAEYFLPQEGGAVAVSGIIFQSIWSEPGEHRLRVDVLDRCGRTGSAERVLKLPSR